MPFESGADLDFAGSADSKSPFTTGGDDEFALDEEAMAINPFKPKNADRIPPMPSMPKAGRVPDPALKAQPKAEEPKEAANIKTYGKVSSGVDAFKKPAKEEHLLPQQQSRSLLLLRLRKQKLLLPLQLLLLLLSRRKLLFLLCLLP